jgi:hypothetical protein
MSFKDFVNQQIFIEFAEQAFESGTSHKTRSASKAEIMDIWQKLRPDTPIYIMPMDDTFNLPGDHSTYGEDGVRITGSWPFIASILGRLKELMTYENPQTKLKLVFRGIKADNKASAERQSYAFYVNAERRKPKTIKPKLPKI